MMRRAVQSIVSQDYPGEIEVLIVFDACDEEAPRRLLSAVPHYEDDDESSIARVGRCSQHRH